MKKRKRNYRKEYDRDQKKRVGYRSKLNKFNRKKKTYGNGDKKDASHTEDGKLVMEAEKKNRSRNGKDGKSTKKKRYYRGKK